jgi:DNA-binding MurR/RpiR family transcriptional regulator
VNAKFLESLIGKTVREARAEIERTSHEIEVHRIESAITAQARPNTVILFHRDSRVVNVAAGDPLELDQPLRGRP